MIVESATFVTLLGGGELPDAAFDMALSRASVLVAADGGAEAALARGHIPDAVIGDLDSLSTAAMAQIPGDRLHRITEQDSTDFDKALRSIRAPGVLAIGFTGRRTDHELAAYHAMVQPGRAPTISIGAEDITFAAPPEIFVELEPDTRVSLFPLAPVTVTAEGLEWPLDTAHLDPLDRIGTSNRATGGGLRIRTHAPGLLIILPRAALDAAMRGLFGG